MIKLAAIGLGVVQVVDVILHVGTGQPEPLRITANLIMLLWAAAAAAGWLRGWFRPVAMLALAAYLALNGLFLALEGVTNPAQGGAPRAALFVLVAATVGLMGALIALRAAPRAA